MAAFRMQIIGQKLGQTIFQSNTLEKDGLAWKH